MTKRRLLSSLAGCARRRGGLALLRAAHRLADAPVSARRAARRRLRRPRFPFRLRRDAAGTAPAFHDARQSRTAMRTGASTTRCSSCTAPAVRAKVFWWTKFAGVLFGKGQLLDANRYYVILPDGIGHGKSSKPSDGLHAHFPQYDYEDMVAAQNTL